MVNIDVDRSGVEDCDSSANKCQGETKDSLYQSCRSCPLSDDRSSVSYIMRKDKFEVKSRGKSSAREKLRDLAARAVGFDPKVYSKPFRGRTRDLKAIITAVRFKQIMLKQTSRKKDLMKEAILMNTMKRAEEEIFIRGRQRQLLLAQAVAEAKAKEAVSSDEKSVVEYNEDDEAVKSLEQFMQSLSSVMQ